MHSTTRRRGALLAGAAALLLAGCDSSSDSRSSGAGAAASIEAAQKRAKAPCEQLAVAALDKAFGAKFRPGVLDDSISGVPSCDWAGSTFDVSLLLLPALPGENYESELADETDTITHRRTSPKFGTDSTLSTDSDLPGTTTLSVLDGNLEWVIDVDRKGSADGRAGLLTLAKTLF